MSSIRKIDNNTFLVNIDDHPQRVLVEVDHIETSLQCRVVNILVNNLSTEIISNHLKDLNLLRVDGKEFLVREKNSYDYLSLLSNFIYKGNFENPYKIQLIPLDEVDNERLWRIHNNTAPLFAIDKPMELLSPENRFNGLRQEGLFADPFSQLAAHAFQNYHEDFSQKDAIAKKANLILTMERRDRFVSYLLCDADNFKPEKYLAHTDVVALYFQQLVYLWGAAKIDLLQHRYGIDFKTLMHNDQPLTVDIVYKFNIGCGLLEIQDLDHMREKLNLLHQDLIHFKPSALLADMLASSQELNVASAHFLSYLHLQAQKPIDALAVKDALDWFDTHPFFAKKECSQLSTNEFAILMQICQLTPAERIARYTGRQMGGFIDSSYTYASRDSFKPWLDDHELSECCDQLLLNYSWEYFTQQLSFIVCKKHLLHRHPVKEYYVGALIPAPCKDINDQEWYKVTTFINSGTGNLSYTLEPVATDSTLPVIKLFRSTASDAYAMDSKASIRSDTNALNSPGYEGEKLVEPYEKCFFLERTIPLWVGYQYLASARLESMCGHTGMNLEGLDEVAAHLEQASIAWAEQEFCAARQLSVGEFLRAYDWVIFDCLQECFKTLPYVVTLHFYLIVKKYGDRFKGHEVGLEESHRDADFIIAVLNAIPTPGRLAVAEELEKNILQHDRTAFEKAEETIYSQYSRILGKLGRFHEQKQQHASLEELFFTLKEWSDEIYHMAMLKNENIESKKNQSILCVGHSLGGALAQRTFAKYTLLIGRIPLPTQKIELYEFDAPGINWSDNQKFIEIGNRHISLLSRWPALTIHRRQAMGDIVPLGGTTHLGATFTHEDTQAALQWLRFDAYLLTPTQKATHAGITDTRFTHGTQFYAPEYHRVLTSKIHEFHKIPFDTAVQGSFSAGMHDLQHALWQLDKVVSLFISIEKNDPWLRTALRLDAFVFLNLDLVKTEDPLHGRWYEKTTPQGVLVANEHGLVSHR